LPPSFRLSHSTICPRRDSDNPCCFWGTVANLPPVDFVLREDALLFFQIRTPLYPHCSIPPHPFLDYEAGFRSFFFLPHLKNMSIRPYKSYPTVFLYFSSTSGIFHTDHTSSLSGRLSRFYISMIPELNVLSSGEFFNLAPSLPSPSIVRRKSSLSSFFPLLSLRRGQAIWIVSFGLRDLCRRFFASRRQGTSGFPGSAI